LACSIPLCHRGSRRTPAGDGTAATSPAATTSGRSRPAGRPRPRRCAPARWTRASPRSGRRPPPSRRRPRRGDGLRRGRRPGAPDVGARWRRRW
jgi:hypothetical protein